MSAMDDFAEQMAQWRTQGQYRQLSMMQHDGIYAWTDQRRLLNLSGNDYLGLAGDTALRERFWAETGGRYALGSASSRLLTGNDDTMTALEHKLAQAYGGRAALLFNSGYHANSGILPAICDRNTVILADKLVHASLIDGMRLSAARFVRYRHQDNLHLRQLLARFADESHVKRIIVVTESIFSMDGDVTDLRQLVSLKRDYPQVMLYVDEAHAVGVRGNQGLGCAEEQGVLNQIDILVGTFGKALASMGAYVICHPILREYLINTARPLIFSTALPPVNWAWSDFVWTHVVTMQSQRQHLKTVGQQLRAAVALLAPHASGSHIVPIMVGDSAAAVAKAKRLAAAGFSVMAVRPPTVPAHSARLRISLNSQIQWAHLTPLLALLADNVGGR